MSGVSPCLVPSRVLLHQGLAAALMSLTTLTHVHDYSLLPAMSKWVGSGLEGLEHRKMGFVLGLAPGLARPTGHADAMPSAPTAFFSAWALSIEGTGQGCTFGRRWTFGRRDNMASP